MTAFDICYASVISAEGGYVNDPVDSGGVTNLGVTKRRWEEWLGHPVTITDMRALTVAQVAPFYRVKYWNAVHCDSFPVALALCLFHAAVNCGPGRAAQFLQGVVGATPDGAIGPGTLRAVNSWLANYAVRRAVTAFQDTLRAYYKTRPTFDHFGKGWLNRAADVEKQAMELAR